MTRLTQVSGAVLVLLYSCHELSACASREFSGGKNEIVSCESSRDCPEHYDCSGGVCTSELYETFFPKFYELLKSELDWSTNPGPWSEWSACSASCGPGIQYRTRTCPSQSCSSLMELLPFAMKSASEKFAEYEASKQAEECKPFEIKDCSHESECHVDVALALREEAHNMALSGLVVVISDADTREPICNITSDADGVAHIPDLELNTTYVASVKDPFSPGNFQSHEFTAGDEGEQPEFVLGRTPVEKFTLVIRDAVNNKPIVDVQGTYQIENAKPVDFQTNRRGEVDIHDLFQSDRIQISLRKDGFIPIDDYTAKVPNKDESTESLPMTRKLKEDELLRAVLSWGEKPDDLDLFVKVAEPVRNRTVCTVYFNHKTCPIKSQSGPLVLSLDVDNRHGGAAGSETMTWHSGNPDKISGIYVHNYSAHHEAKSDGVRKDAEALKMGESQ